MAQTQIAHGSASITVQDHITPPEKAGKMSEEEIQRTPKTPTGTREACDQAANAMERAGPAFSPPQGITPESLRQAGARVADTDEAIAQVLFLLVILKQARLLFGAEALRQLGEVNDQAQTQGKRRHQLKTLFHKLIAFFKKTRKPKAETSELPAPAPVVELGTAD